MVEAAGVEAAAFLGKYGKVFKGGSFERRRFGSRVNTPITPTVGARDALGSEDYGKKSRVPFQHIKKGVSKPFR